MGPTNVALLKLFKAEQALRAAQQRLDTVTRDVRIQERRVNDLQEKLTLARSRHMEQQAKAGALEVDVRSRNDRIEKLRGQQQFAKDNKEYQAFLLEISTGKADKAKIEEEQLTVMVEVEKFANEMAELETQLTAEQAKLVSMRQAIGERSAALQKEIDQLVPVRDEAAQAIPIRLRQEFERLADRYDGEAMASISRPNRRVEEYTCNACNMDLVSDIYNRLHSRDEGVFCPSCRRLLFIPEDLPPDAAVNKVKKPRPPKADKATATEEPSQPVSE